MQGIKNGVIPAKRVYKRPELQVMGSVVEMTQAPPSGPPGNKTGTLHDGNGYAPWVQG